MSTLATAELLRLRPEKGGSIDLYGHVARLRKSHRGARVVRAPGFGVAIESAPEAFFALITDLDT